MASKCFVLAFGGTGARCVEALTYLAAAGVMEQPMHILLVDPDENNGNTVTATGQMRAYHRIHSQVNPPSTDAPVRPFFSTSLNIAAGDDRRAKGQDSFVWKYGSADRPWQDLIGYSSTWREEGDASNGLYELLYSADDMEMTFQQGYVGRAHIGSLDILKTFRGASEAEEGKVLGEFLRSLEDAAKNGASLLVIGSIFGGTGASGIPAIPPFIQADKRFAETFGKIHVGSVQVAPYFSFASSDDPDLPDSRLHPLVTQSALYHYGTTPVGYDRVYLIGAPQLGTTNNKNIRGGGAQKNRAHFAELAAALAACHFFATPGEKCKPGESPSVLACYSEKLEYNAFPFSGQTNLKQKLISFTTFCAFHALYADPNVKFFADHPFMKEMKRKTNSILEPGDADFNTLTEFSQRFLSWFVEVREFAKPLLTDAFVQAILKNTESLAFWKEDQDGKVLGMVAPDSIAGRGAPYAAVIGELNTVKKDAVQQVTPLGFYIDLVSRTISEFCKSNYTAWER